MAVILITGATSGIGNATARALAREGHHVYAASRRVELLKKLASSEDRISPLRLDVTDIESVEAATALFVRESGCEAPDVLVNCAGIAVFGALDTAPPELIRQHFEVNVLGAFNIARPFLPAMRHRGHGRLINVSSILGRFTLPATGVYSASKYALEAVSDNLRMELAPYGVKVVLVEPGVTSTPLYSPFTGADGVRPYVQQAEHSRGLPNGAALSPKIMRRAMPADYVARVIVKAATSRRPRARYVVGVRNRLNTAALTLAPTRVGDQIKIRV